VGGEEFEGLDSWKAVGPMSERVVLYIVGLCVAMACLDACGHLFYRQFVVGVDARNPDRVARIRDLDWYTVIDGSPNGNEQLKDSTYRLRVSVFSKDSPNCNPEWQTVLGSVQLERLELKSDDGTFSAIRNPSLREIKPNCETRFTFTDLVIPSGVKAVHVRYIGSYVENGRTEQIDTLVTFKKMLGKQLGDGPD
jgi:hypothetical protein